MSPIRRRLFLLGITATITAVSTFAAPTASSAVTAPNCGTTITKADGSTWTCTFADEFSSNTLDTTKWAVQQTPTSGYTTGPLGSEVCYINTANNVRVSGGYLNLTIRKETAPFKCGALPTQYTGGMVTGFGKFSQTYGRFEVRAKVPATAIAGLQESFWLWPVNATKYGAEPRSGEIDFAELYSLRPTLAIPYVHYTPATADPNVTSYNCTISNLNAFHTYALEWTPTTLTMIYDGGTCLVDNWNAATPLTGSAPFDSPFFLALTQALGIGDNAFNPAKTPLPATTQVDYVHIWK